MSNNTFNYEKKISGMLASLTAFLCTIIIFIKSSAIDLSVLIHTLTIVIPATFAMWILGSWIGKILDSTKKKKSLGKSINKLNI